MDSVAVNTSILKRDVLGRVTLKREQREALLDEFERSGMKGQPFARMAGVNYQTFASWIQKRRHARGHYPQKRAPSIQRLKGAAFQLVEVSLPAVMTAPSAPKADTAALELLLPGGARLLMHDAHQAELAAHLLHHLNTASSLPC